ncbi:MAG: M48 family metalloprotease [Anaerolineae bacterium]|nr:M48 family metalloprotease [Anaerolineae bacterium]MCI0608558.1 M48 family metalloprotease [Anaerolineae bacterium]
MKVCFINDAGYNPEELISVMQVLDEASQGNEPPEFFSTHPNPERRIERIQEAIQNVSACP